MAPLSRVPPPRSPFDGRWAGVGAIGVALLVVAIAKPWSDDPTLNRSGPTPWPDRANPTAVARIPVPPRTLLYDPSRFGAQPPSPAWEIWATEPLVHSSFTGPPEPAVPPAAVPGSVPSAPAPTALIGGPVIELGSSDTLTALAVNVPDGVSIAAVRLWRFVDGGAPERVELTELRTNRPAAHFRAYGLRTPSLPPEEVIAWEPGLYRLDLLVDPADRIRSLMVTVRPGTVAAAGDAGTGAEPAGRDPIDPALVERLPDEATLWTLGALLTGWARPSADGSCRVAEMWRGGDGHEGCRPLPIGVTRALGVNLPPANRPESIRLVAVDPLPGAIDLEADAPFPGTDGIALIETPPGGLPDGIYRLDVRVAGGRLLHWYVEVSPAGRRAAELTAPR